MLDEGTPGRPTLGVRRLGFFSPGEEEHEEICLDHDLRRKRGSGSRSVMMGAIAGSRSRNSSAAPGPFESDRSRVAPGHAPCPSSAPHGIGVGGHRERPAPLAHRDCDFGHGAGVVGGRDALEVPQSTIRRIASTLLGTLNIRGEVRRADAAHSILLRKTREA